MTEIKKHYIEDIVKYSWINDDGVIDKHEINKLKKVLSKEDWEKLDIYFKKTNSISKLSELKQSLISGTILDSTREIELLDKSGYLENKELVTNINNSYQKHLINIT